VTAVHGGSARIPADLLGSPVTSAGRPGRPRTVDLSVLACAVPRAHADERTPHQDYVGWPADVDEKYFLFVFRHRDSSCFLTSVHAWMGNAARLGIVATSIFL
jgi:hypothetical protein